MGLCLVGSLDIFTISFIELLSQGVVDWSRVVSEVPSKYNSIKCNKYIAIIYSECSIVIYIVIGLIKTYLWNDYLY